MKKTLFLVGLCLSLSACGFTPMYGTKFQDSNIVDIRSELANIEIANISNYEGQYLRNALMDRFYTNARPMESRYVLRIAAIQERITNLDITINSNATRAQLHLNTKMSLTDKQSGEVVLERNLSSTSGYNILTSEFATRVSEKNMRKNTLNDLAHQIETQIGLYLKR